MNRITIAVLMLLLAGIICGCEFYTVSNSVIQCTAELDTIKNLSEQGDFDKANEITDNLLENWIKTTRRLDKYLYHDYIDEITLHMSALPVCTENQDSSAVKTHIEEIKIQLTSLKESELPYLHNIL